MNQNEPLFDNARAALIFALTFSAEQYDRPGMNKAGAPPTGKGLGLVGMDGAGQAGMILGQLRKFRVDHPLYEHLLVSLLAPQNVACGCGVRCCCGYTPNEVFVGAVEQLTHAVVEPLQGCYTHYLSRKLLVLRYLGERRGKLGLGSWSSKMTIIDIADRVNMDRDTVGDHNRRIRDWLTKEENRAWRAIEEHLVAAGVVKVAATA